MALNVAPGSRVNTDEFEFVLVVIKEAKSYIGFWSSIDWINLGVNHSTLKIIKSSDLDLIDISDRYPGPELITDRVLISRPPLTIEQTTNLIDGLNEERVIFSRTLINLETLDQLATNQTKDYNSILVAFYAHLDAVTSTWSNQTTPVKLSKYDIKYANIDPENILASIKSEFNQLQYQVNGPLPIDQTKLTLAMSMLEILKTGLASESLIQNFINNVLGSAELCSLLHLLSSFPKQIKISQTSIELGLLSLSREETRIMSSMATKSSSLNILN
jgi:hypothetical protein